jgi:hypothetical protein
MDSSNNSLREKDLKEKAKEFRRLKNEMMRSRRAVNVLTGEEAVKLDKETAFKEMVTPLEQRTLKYIKRKSDFGDRDSEVSTFSYFVLLFFYFFYCMYRQWRNYRSLRNQ